MSVVAAEPDRPAPASALEHPRNVLSRAWSAPVWAHLLVLGVVLAALIPIVGSNVVFSADEGAAAVQAESLAGGDGWIVEHPLPEAEPAGGRYPLENSEVGPRGSAPFAKHPAYALLLAGAGRLAGFPGMVALSILGTIAAAGLAAALARRLDPALARPALWVVGVASPLFFDGYIVIAHTLAAAAAAAAVLLAVVAVERRSALVGLAVAPAMVAACLLRNEALFLGIALGITAAAVALGRRSFPAVVVAGAAMIGAVVTHVGERVWVRHILGGGGVSVGGSVPSGGGSFLAGRFRGFAHTWLTASYTGHRTVSVLLLVMLVALVVGAVAVRRHPKDGGRIVFLATVAAAAAVVALLVRPGNVVPGLLIAFPLATVGMLLLRREHLTTTAAQIALGTTALFAGAVLATQYDRGGTAEWGGRYFALALPVIVPVLLLALRDAGRRLDQPTRTRVAAALVVCSVALTAMAVGGLRHHHRFTADLTSSIDRAGAQAAPAPPVYVTTTGLIPRLMWRGFEDQRWLLAAPSELKGLADRLRVSGVTRFVLVTPDLARDAAELDGVEEVASVHGRPDGKGWQVRVFQVT